MSPFHEGVVPLRAPVPVASVQGTLALDLQPRHDPPTFPDLPGRPAGDVIPIDQAMRRQVEGWARRYVQAATEIVGGDRPVTQLLRWSTRDVYVDLQRRALLVARAGGHRPGQGAGPARATSRRRGADLLPVPPGRGGQRPRAVRRTLARPGGPVRAAGRPLAVHRPRVRLSPPGPCLPVSR